MRQRPEAGPLLWEYRPPRAHPILYAGLLVFTVVLLSGSAEVALRGAPPGLYAVYAMPLVGTAALLVLLMPGPVRIHEHGIAPGWRVAERPFRPALVPWSSLAAVYPVQYDVTGAFVSPFASSDGKVTQMGLGLEGADGRVRTVRFTPTRFALGARSSRGYREGIEVVRELFARQGRPLVPPTRAAAMTEAEREALLREARRPFLPFFAIVLLLSSGAPAVLGLLRLGMPVPAALALALVVPLGTSLLSWTRSRRRNRIMGMLHRSAEAARAAGAGA